MPFRRAKVEIKKKQFCRHDIKTFYVIYPLTEISHQNRLMHSTLEFLKIKQTPRKS
jgi:hypothetical protein